MVHDCLKYLLSCLVVRCTNLPKAPLHGQALTQKNSSDFFYFGDSVEYRCDFGYTLTTDTLSSDVLMCDASSASDTTGSFDVTAPTCSGGVLFGWQSECNILSIFFSL